MAWNEFEHSIWKRLKDLELDKKSHFILAVSGGVDSVCLFQIMRRLKPQAQLTVCYFHHGPALDPEQVNYRNQCRDLVQTLCLKNNVEFKTAESLKLLSSEDQMRQARWEFLRSCQKSASPILTAHHLDDWVETVTLKMIRGVAADGFQAFKMWDREILRPFLETSKDILLAYAQENQLQWLEDPSNQSADYLRNWVRHHWFAQLDEKVPAGYQNYSRSLLRLCQELNQTQPLELRFFGDSPVLGLDRQWYSSLTDKLQLKALALYMRHHSIFEYSSGQLAEIQKRLDKNQKDITFTVAHVKWVINETQIMLV
ncbi:MAG: tRNA lysidine(34) synthetase TilS [Bdellovibrionales bacterium RIFCSPHIGHO2_01_FULL_40_29]|nr:MAG: tRNA lysidine(34) synthetase TilS [Bdellovibrionales bacterium RIFCSPHIGHO2_01_FULL_40_29]